MCHTTGGTAEVLVATATDQIQRRGTPGRDAARNSDFCNKAGYADTVGARARGRATAAAVAALASTCALAGPARASSPGIPRAARAQLLGSALTVAAAEGDRHPHDIRAVRTTSSGAGRAIHCDCTFVVPPPSAPVYLVAMRGHFSCNTCSSPHGRTIGPGTVITLEFPVATPSHWTDFGFGNRYPNLRAAGTPVRLAR